MAESREEIAKKNGQLMDKVLEVYNQHRTDGSKHNESLKAAWLHAAMALKDASQDRIDHFVISCWCNMCSSKKLKPESIPDQLSNICDWLMEYELQSINNMEQGLFINPSLYRTFYALLLLKKHEAVRYLDSSVKERALQEVRRFNAVLQQAVGHPTAARPNNNNNNNNNNNATVNRNDDSSSDEESTIDLADIDPTDIFEDPINPGVDQNVITLKKLLSLDDDTLRSFLATYGHIHHEPVYYFVSKLYRAKMLTTSRMTEDARENAVAEFITQLTAKVLKLTSDQANTWYGDDNFTRSLCAYTYNLLNKLPEGIDQNLIPKKAMLAIEQESTQRVTPYFDNHSSNEDSEESALDHTTIPAPAMLKWYQSNLFRALCFVMLIVSAAALTFGTGGIGGVVLFTSLSAVNIGAAAIGATLATASIAGLLVSFLSKPKQEKSASTDNYVELNDSLTA